MSLNREYETSKAGPTTIIAFTATALRIRLALASATGFQKRSFAIRVTTAARILQGNKDVSATATTGMYLTTSLRWRIDVDSAEDAFLSILRDTANGNIEITRISDIISTDLPVAV